MEWQNNTIEETWVPGTELTTHLDVSASLWLFQKKKIVNSYIIWDTVFSVSFIQQFNLY